MGEADPVAADLDDVRVLGCRQRELDIRAKHRGQPLHVPVRKQGRESQDLARGGR
jgi:hypothetical protein